MTNTERLSALATFLLDLVAVWGTFLLPLLGLTALALGTSWVRTRRAQVRQANARRAAARQQQARQSHTRVAS